MVEDDAQLADESIIIQRPYTEAEMALFMSEKCEFLSLRRFFEKAARRLTVADCKCLEEVQKIGEWPFYRPVVVNQGSRNLECPGWAVRLFNETPSGRISSKPAGSLFLNFCPICGERLHEIKEDKKNVSGRTN